MDGPGWSKLELRYTGKRVDVTGGRKLELRYMGSRMDGLNWS